MLIVSYFGALNENTPMKYTHWLDYVLSILYPTDIL